MSTSVLLDIPMLPIDEQTELVLYENPTVTNQPPVANGDSGSVFEDGVLYGNVLENDSDPEGDPLKVTAVNGNPNAVGTGLFLDSGALIIVNEDGSYFYDTNGKFDGLNDQQTATDRFEYTISDSTETFTYTAINNGGFTATANLTITVQGFNDLPAGFDAAQYGASNPDLIPVYHDDLTGLTNHYLLHGRAEKRPLDNFDELRYVASNPDLITAFGLDGKKATEHYLKYGFDEKRSKTAFSPSRYLDSYPDLIAAPTIGTNTVEATKPYISSGFAEKRDPNLFASDRYIASYGDLINSYRYNLESGSNHYLFSGRGEGRKVTFDPLAYLAKYPDLADLDPTGATRHYIESGFAENRPVA